MNAAVNADAGADPAANPGAPATGPAGSRRRWRCVAAGLATLSALAGCATPDGPAGVTGAAPTSTARAATPTTVHLLAINDFHGNLLPPAPLREADPQATPRPVGGADVLAGYVRTWRGRHQDGLVVSAGDLVGASPLVSALFRDEGTIEVMNRIGLDINAVGNHEFDDGRAELLRLADGGCHPSGEQTCRGADVGTPVPFEGAKFEFLAANVRDAASGTTLFAPYTVRTVGGARVAFIGLTLRGTPDIVDAAGIQGLTFLPEAATINALVPVLRGQGIEAIVVLLHEGGDVAGPRNITTLDGCAGTLAGSPLQAIVAQLDDAIDLVVSGHTHQAYICRLANAAGRAIPATSAHDYGRVVTAIELDLDARGDVARVRARNVPLLRDAAAGRDDPRVGAVAPVGDLPQVRDEDLAAPDPAIAALVGRYAALAKPLADRIVGHIAAALPALPGASGESPLGRVIADSQLAATRAAGAQVALMNPGGIRAGLDWASSPAGEGDGAVTWGELFTVQPFANALVTLTLTGAQLHGLLEQQFGDCLDGRPVAVPSAPSPSPPPSPPPGTPAAPPRLLQVSAGFTYAWREGAPACARVQPDSLRIAGAVVDPARDYRITVNSFLAGGGDGLAVLRAGRDRRTGIGDLDAMARWLAAGVPADDRPRITRLAGERGATDAAAPPPGAPR